MIVLLIYFHLDTCAAVPYRCLWFRGCGLSFGGQQPASVDFQYILASCRTEYVQQSELWMGKLLVGIHRLGIYSSTCPLLQVRGAPSC